MVAGGFGEDAGDGFACEVFCGDLFCGEFGELGFLIDGGRGVDALVDGVAVFGGEFGVDLAGIFAGDGGHLGCEEAGDEAVLVGGPDLAVTAEEGGAGGLFAYEAEGAVEESVDEPLEADGDFEHGARLRPLVTRSMMEEETTVLPTPTFSLQSGRWVKRYWMQTAR